ncbi:hypothetical protein JQ609_21365 [Bradyrhizobium sp. AUGA SZCCT0169]|uniref:hypothetical protein n=1 Tax=Bradyrhizobium sp. AUGA SZCCT0169 TaxID=2807663 RepID=UPI001BA94B2A|nr:hypothetical protein [Bradyrhizobium sp. AUGA SZCCT0169]MBR1249466.1 hypothetical protein [Bradyrhizobium sp. AUGA SZCCT0169]
MRNSLSERKDIAGRHPLRGEHLRLILICLHILVCCISLVFVATIYPEYHIFFRAADLAGAVVIVAAFALVALLFVFAEFSFGYFIGFFFYTMALGYLWINYFSLFDYNHRLTGLSAAASAIVFLLPLLLVRSPVRQIWTLSSDALDRLLSLILLAAAATIVVGASYNFRFVTVGDIYTYREALQFPAILNYLTAIMTTALLPFAFACLVERKCFWRAGGALILLLLFYPVTLTKLALFTPALLVGMIVLCRLLEARTAVIMSVLAPMTVGLILFLLYRYELLHYNVTITYFGLVNFRMIAIPSMAMDYYNDFFSRHDVTYFCQIRLLKPFVSCPYQEQLAVVIYKAFGIGGYFNASLFATEGVASVGPIFAPVVAFACGLVIALGNRLSAGLPPRFILLSGAVLPQAFLNIPLTTVLISHGAALLFLLWYFMPRTMTAPSEAPKPAAAD